MQWNFFQRTVSEETRPFTLPGQSARRARFDEYYGLIKPGIVYGNVFVAIATYLYAARWIINIEIFSALLIGLSFVIASAAILNNYFDREIDKQMERTKNRALATGAISTSFALAGATVLGIAGFGVLLALVNPLSAFCAFIGFFVYLALYGTLKRATPWGLLIGAVSGAMPILVGYTAATERIDLATIILFLILFVWQIPHFLAIAIYHFDEYRAAGIPTFAIRSGARATKYAIASGIIFFTALVGILFALGYIGAIVTIVITIACALWLRVAIRGFSLAEADEKTWGRRMFYSSLLVLFAFTILLSIGSLLP